ncbi:MAG: endo-1,4-beta-xylanase [Mojavia pulchra JT2-VF2]|jgi:endo-1,4-beta-xylanase|uniref:Beta-xylanase n=1 Tax=Mojavia pulchra JT2-VF2 TaxID=287848 RepID=A0A951Q2P9_9NOST|nr:endo-1,4-beta-xylanase [Mojavia pulchra JT2-VF2]
MLKNMLMNRRYALWLGLGTLGAIGALAKGKAMYSSHKTQDFELAKNNFSIAGKASLKQRAAAKGLIYGAAIPRLYLSSDQKLAARLAQECGILTPEWELKWSAGHKPLRPSPDTFDFTAGDWMAKFARTHRMLLRGHTLVWHESLPTWFKETVNRQNAEQFLVKHIQTVVTHYAGQMHSWDVVNEAIEVKDGRSDGLRKTPWLEFLGTDYIDLAFRLAAEFDPKALLVYNDYGLEYDTSHHEAKRKAVLKLLERLKSRGVPIHALGMQSHMDGNEKRFNPKKLQNFLANVADLGLKIMITEMDVTDKKLPRNPVVRDRMVAAVYQNYLSVVLNEPAVTAVMTWGISDRYTWLSKFQPRSDGAAVRPLPLDSNFRPKLAWNAIARAFDKAPRR